MAARKTKRLGERVTLAELKASGWLGNYSKPSKYGNKRTTVDGIKFDSRKEANRDYHLKLLQLAGKISDLELQKKFDIHGPDGEHFMSYVADFVYTENGEEVVEDVKSEATKRNAVYRIKKKAMKIFWGIEIREV